MAAVGIADHLETDDYIFMARIAEKAGRYVEMANFMDKFVLTSLSVGIDLDDEERKLLDIAYKNVVDPLRSALSVIHSAQQEDEDRIDDFVTVHYQLQLHRELNEVCGSILKLLEDLIPVAPCAESKVFYLKTKGDYHRYMAEYLTGYDQTVATFDSRAAYKKAQDIAFTKLYPGNPLRLALALNFSLLYHDILKDENHAWSLAKKALEELDFLPDLDSQSEESYEDCTDMIEALRDNLIKWSSDKQVCEQPLSDDEN
ncbi:hypothetical protein Dimus_025032 [Dionaea muscipula]